MAIVVSDTSPIRALAFLGLLDLLSELFGQVLVPPAVAKELSEPSSRFAVVDVRTFSYVQVQAPRDATRILQFRKHLDPGESEALRIALEVKAVAVLMDEAAGRAMAKEVGLQPIGVLGVLLRAKQRGRLASIAPLFDRLNNDLGFFLSDELRTYMLRLAGE